jgi:hypothetical protein
MIGWADAAARSFNFLLLRLILPPDLSLPEHRFRGIRIRSKIRGRRN